MLNRRGFTLVEILISMLISSVLVLGIHAAHRQARVLWTRAEDGREAYYLTRVLTETLRTELSGLYMPPPDANEQAARDSAFRLTGVRGEMTELCFFTLTPAWRGSVESSGIARVRYRFGKEQGMGEPALQRSEVLCSGAQLLGQENSEVLANGLAEFTVQVVDPNGDGSADSWRESYESNDRPPKAVKVLLKWGSRNQRGRPPEQAGFESIMSVPSEGPVVPGAG